eukprot:4407471-Alexandrium_andersonii.AAC.1
MLVAGLQAGRELAAEHEEGDHGHTPPSRIADRPTKEPRHVVAGQGDQARRDEADGEDGIREPPVQVRRARLGGG